MKRWLFFLSLGILSATVRATVIPPADARGVSLLTTDFVGALPCSIDSSTGTSLVVCNSTGTGGISMGPAVVYGIVTSSVAQGDYIVFKDSTGVGTSGFVAAQTGAGSLQSIGTTVTVIGNIYQSNVSSYNVAPLYPVLNVIKFPVPIQFQNGIVVNASASPVGNNGISRWTILWRPLYSGKANQGSINFTPVGQ